jgi:flavin-dependent dehydrogenase
LPDLAGAAREFDQLLLDHARSKGVEVIEEITVKELLRGEDGRVTGVRAQEKSGDVVEFRAPITLDCSGKEAFSAVRNGWRTRDPFLNKVAVWTYYRGSKREPGIDEGQTTVAYVREKGWFWHIPQHNDMVSVGVVAEGKHLTRDGVKDPKTIFHREVEENLWIKDHLSAGEQVGPYRIVSEYTQHARHCASEGLLLVGDAFAFLDPVFSSGLMLALKSGVMAGDAVHQALAAQDFAPARFAEYGRAMGDVERAQACRLLRPRFSSTLIDKYPGAAGEITDCLSGGGQVSRRWAEDFGYVPLPDELPVENPRAEVESLNR